MLVRARAQNDMGTAVNYYRVLTPEEDAMYRVESTTTYTTEFVISPPAVGEYMLSPDMSIALSQKPSRWARFWVRTLLGWRWRDA